MICGVNSPRWHLGQAVGRGAVDGGNELPHRWGRRSGADAAFTAAEAWLVERNITLGS
jgi:hypothetical protein